MKITSDQAFAVNDQKIRELIEVDVKAALNEARQLVDQYGRLQHTTHHQKALLLLGEVQIASGDLENALQNVQKAEKGALIHGNDEITAQSRMLLARIFWRQGINTRAQELLEDPIVRHHATKNISIAIHTKTTQGFLAYAKGESLIALNLFEETLEIASENQLLLDEAEAIINIANMLVYLGDYNEALSKYEQAKLKLIASPQRSTLRELKCLNGIGGAQLSLGRYPESILSFRSLMELAAKMGNIFVELMGVANLCESLIEYGNYGEARQLLLNKIQLTRDAQLDNFEIILLIRLGVVSAKMQKFSAAKAYFLEVQDKVRKLATTEHDLEITFGLAESSMYLGELDEAEQAFLALVEKTETIGALNMTAKVREHLSQLYKLKKDYQKALENFEYFHEISNKIYDEKNSKRINQLTTHLELERTRHEAENYRIQHETALKAREEAEALVRERTRELEQAQKDIVSRLAVAAEYRDDATGEHTKRVGYYVAALGLELELSDEECYLLLHASRLHDVGKIGVPDHILLKKGKLTDEEFEIIKQHTIIGKRILDFGSTPLLRMACDIVVSHHEHWIGTGYPHGLVGEDIPLSGRLVAVADVFDALTHARSYKPAWSVEDAIIEISSLSGTRFDPKIVAASQKVFARIHDPAGADLPYQLGLGSFLSHWGLQNYTHFKLKH